MIATGLIGLYLTAIIAANLSSAHFGAGASIYNAFAFIGLSLSTRDKLHDLWGRHRVRNMALLIGVGSGLSYVASITLAPNVIPSEVVARIALASCAAFACAETIDAVGYHLLRRRPWMERVTSSNFFSAPLDSIVFVSIAFGWTWEIIVAQTCAKIAGGYVWALVLRHVGRTPQEAEA